MASPRDFQAWYRVEHFTLVAALGVAAGDLQVAQDIAAEAFARALERWDRVSLMASPPAGCIASR